MTIKYQKRPEADGKTTILFPVTDTLPHNRLKQIQEKVTAKYNKEQLAVNTQYDGGYQIMFKEGAMPSDSTFAAFIESIEDSLN